MADQRCGTCRWLTAHKTDDKRLACLAPIPFWADRTDQHGHDINGVLPDFAYDCACYQRLSLLPTRPKPQTETGSNGDG